MDEQLEIFRLLLQRGAAQHGDKRRAQPVRFIAKLAS